MKKVVTLLLMLTILVSMTTEADAQSRKVKKACKVNVYQENDHKNTRINADKDWGPGTGSEKNFIYVKNLGPHGFWKSLGLGIKRTVHSMFYKPNKNTWYPGHLKSKNELLEQN